MSYTVQGIADKMKATMDVGAIYFEFSDGYRCAFHKDAYTKVTNDDGVLIEYMKYRIDKLITGPVGRNIVHYFYKTTKGWVDFQKVSSIEQATPFAYAEQYGHMFLIDNSLIKSVDYTDANQYVHQIDAYDGHSDLTSSSVMINHDRLDDSLMKIEICKMDNPGETRPHHMDDIKITLLKTGYDSSNMLVWLNGIFVPYQKDYSDDKIIYIKYGKLFTNTVVRDYEGTDALPYRDASFEATIEPSKSKQLWRYNVDVQLFKWTDTAISMWNAPNTVSVGNLIYDDPILSLQRNISYIDTIEFDVPVNKNSHVLLLNGIIVSPEFYKPDPNNSRKLLLTGARSATNNFLLDLIEKGVSDPGMKVKGIIPSSGNYSLVNFSSTDPLRNIFIRRSVAVKKNSPTPYSFLFKELNLGDLVLIDGLYERYYYDVDHCIEMPLMWYTARFNDYNSFNNSRIERLYIGFKEKIII